MRALTARHASRKDLRPRRCQDQLLAPIIHRAFGESRSTDGTTRRRYDLDDLGHRCGRHRIGRLMRVQGLKALQKGRFVPRTTDSSHGPKPAPPAPSFQTSALQARPSLGHRHYLFRSKPVWGPTDGPPAESVALFEGSLFCRKRPPETETPPCGKSLSGSTMLPAFCVRGVRPIEHRVSGERRCRPHHPFHSNPRLREDARR